MYVYIIRLSTTERVDLSRLRMWEVLQSSTPPMFDDELCPPSLRSNFSSAFDILTVDVATYLSSPQKISISSMLI